MLLPVLLLHSVSVCKQSRQAANAHIDTRNNAFGHYRNHNINLWIPFDSRPSYLIVDTTNDVPQHFTGGSQC